MERTGNGIVYMELIFSMLFWGLSFVWFKEAYPDFQPITIIFFRLLISFPFLLSVAKLMGKLTLPKRKDLGLFILLAFFEPFLYFLGESFGLKYVTSTLASVIVATIPLITPFVGNYFFKEKLSVNNYLGIAISFIGVLMVVAFENSVGEAPLIGIILMILAVFSTQGYVVALKKLTYNYNAISIVGFQNMIGAIFFAPLFLLTDFKEFKFSVHSAGDFLPIIYLAIFASSMAFFLYTVGMKRIGLTRSMVFTNFIPVVTAVASVILLKEKMGVIKVMGIVITIFGLFISQRGKAAGSKIAIRINRK